MGRRIGLSGLFAGTDPLFESDFVTKTNDWEVVDPDNIKLPEAPQA